PRQHGRAARGQHAQIGAAPVTLLVDPPRDGLPRAERLAPEPLGEVDTLGEPVGTDDPGPRPAQELYEQAPDRAQADHDRRVPGLDTGAPERPQTAPERLHERGGLVA